MKRKATKRLAKRIPNGARVKLVKRKRNSAAEAARAKYEEFHGKPSTSSYVVRPKVVFPTDVAELGPLVDMVIKLPPGFEPRRVPLTPKGVMLACTPDGEQLHFLGGDQALPLSRLHLEDQARKQYVLVAPVMRMCYRAAKSMDDFVVLNYEHKMGEEGGFPPYLMYDTKSRLIFLAGGSYKVEAPGIMN